MVDKAADESLDIGQVASSIIADVDDKAFALIKNCQDIIKIQIADILCKRWIIHISDGVG